MVYIKSRKARELFTSASKIDMIDLATSQGIVFLPVDHDPFAGPEIIRIAPSTESQKEIWASCMIGGDDANRAYNQSITLHFKGGLDKSAFERALEKLIERNESLRTAFSADGKQLCVFDKQPLDFYYKDLSEIPDAVAERIVQKYIKDDALFVFSLTDGPLLKTGLFKINSNEYKFVLSTHHIICDGWSIGILLQELSTLYSSYTQNLPVQLPAAPLFSEYAFQHHKFIGGADYQTQEEFWLKNLKHDTPVVTLPTDFDRPLVRTYKSGRLDYPVDQEVISQLKKIGIENGCSLVITLTAAFELFLQRLTGQDDLILGLPAADQSASGNLKLIGHCVNLLPLRSKPKPGHTFSEFLKERRAFMFDAYENQQVTFGSLLKKLTIPRDTSRVPLIPVVFNIDMGLTDGVNFSGLDFSFFNNPREYESFELFVNATGSEKSFILEWSYNTQLFKPESINRMMAGFTTVLKTLASNPNVLLYDALERDVDTIQLLSASEQNKLLIDFNSTHLDYPRDKNKTVIDLFSEQVEKSLSSVALIIEDTTLSYSELDVQSNRLANYLLSKGVKEGTLVSVCMERSAGLIVSILAILKTGAAYVPVDPAYPEDRISFMLEDSRAAIVLSSKASRAQIKNSSAVTIIETDGADQAAISQTSAVASSTPVSPESLAYVIYTSGSTGKPKGVEITHKNAGSFISWCQQEFISSPFEIVYFTTSICFDLSIFELFYPLSIGKSIRILENGLAVTNYLTNDSGVLLNTVPSVVAGLLADKADLSNVTVLNMAGEPIPLQIVQNLNTDLIEVRNLYGPTEDTTYSTVYRLRKDEPILIGKPIAGTQIYIVNSQYQICPAGIAGELCIGGDGLAKGYLNRPDLTAEKFVSNPFSKEEGARMYKTGDLARWLPDGNIEYLGRIDDQVKIRGFRIEPGEIEQLLIEQKNIKQALVIAREDRAGDKRLVVYIVTKSTISEMEFQNSIKVWKQAVKSQLPVYMCPADYVNLPSIPLNLNGKIDKAKLPKPGSDKISADFTAPETEMEKLVATNWAQFLGIKNISIHDDFFELGGHSLLAIEALTQLAKQAGKILPVSALLENSTIYKLACLLDNGIAVDRWKSLVAIKTSGTKNPLYIIHGAGLGVWIFTDVISHLHEEQPVYAFQGLGIDGIDEPFETVEETVAFYISELLQQNPTGPYLLAGFSDGGLIAFEMARQLKSMGKHVDMLGLFDTCIQEQASRSKFEKIILRLRRSGHELKSLFIHPRKAIQFQKQIFLIRLLNIAQRFGYKQKDTFRETYPHLYDSMDKYAVSLSKYIRRSYDGDIDLFKTMVRVYYVDDFNYLGWKPYTSGDIIVHDVPGDHDDMILAENAPAFARILQKAIDEK